MIDVGNKRSILVKKNIIGSLFLKITSIIIGFIYVPLILGYLDAERYGIWLTFTSIVGWFTFFDFGLGNGLRNKVTECYAQNDHVLAREYISTTYYYVSVTFIIVFILFVSANKFLDWNSILNVASITNNELSSIALIIFGFFLVRFIFNIILFILKGLQKTALSEVFAPLGNSLSVILIFILTRTTIGSLTNLAWVLSATPLIVLILGTILFFQKNIKLRPSIKYINTSHKKSLFNVGVHFFIIQLAGLILFSSANILIVQLFDPSSVTIYNVAYRYYSMPIMLFSILLNPMWSAFADAYYSADYDWCKKALNKFLKISILFVILALAMLVLSKIFFRMWVGEKVSIPASLSSAFTVFVIFTVIIAPYTNFIAGTGKLRLSLVAVLFKVIAYFPIAIIFAHMFGIAGIIWATVLVNFSSAVLEPIQTSKILSGKACGIWNR